MADSSADGQFPFHFSSMVGARRLELDDTRSNSFGVRHDHDHDGA